MLFIDLIFGIIEMITGIYLLKNNYDSASAMLLLLAGAKLDKAIEKIIDKLM